MSAAASIRFLSRALQTMGEHDMDTVMLTRATVQRLHDELTGLRDALTDLETLRGAAHALTEEIAIKNPTGRMSPAEQALVKLLGGAS